MPQEIPCWKDLSKALKKIRQSTLGKSSKKSFESKCELDELFEGADGADKSGKGTLSWGEVSKALRDELKDRTKLKNSDNLVVESVVEALRRGFHATKNLIPGEGRPDQLEREEFRVMLIYLERFFELLDYFKVVELEKGKPATVKSGGDERPLFLHEKEFAQIIPRIKAWGVQLTGKPNEIFADVSRGSGKIGFDAFAHWALTASLEFVPPEEAPPGSLSAVKSPKVKAAMLEDRKKKAEKEKRDMELEMEELQREKEMAEKMQKQIEEMTAKSEAALQSSKNRSMMSAEKGSSSLW